MKYTAVFIFCFLTIIQGCGGGGGSGSGGPTLPPNNGGNNGTTLNSYSGKKTLAVVDQESAHNLVFHTTTISDLTNVLMFGDEHQELRFDALSSNYNNFPTGDCETGTFTSTQTSDTTADISYNQCGTGPFRINGSGTMTAAQFSSSDNLVAATLQFKDLSITNSLTKLSYKLVGNIQINLENDRELSTFNAVVTETSSNTQYLLENYQVAFSSVLPNLGYSLSGRLYIDNYGYIDIETLQRSIFDFQLDKASPLVLMLQGNARLRLETHEKTELQVSLFSTTTESQTPQHITVTYNFYVNQKFNHSANNLPIVTFQLTSEELNKNQPIVFDASNSKDADNDFIKFNWSVSKQPSGAQVTLEGNGYSSIRLFADTAGEYEISLFGSDGSGSSQSSTFIFYVKKDPPNVTVTAVNQINYGQNFSADVSASNGAQDGPFSYELYFGPTGMTLSDTNEISWNGSPPRLGENLLVNYAVKVSNDDHAVIVRNSVLVTDSLTKPAVYLNAEDVFFTYKAWADVNLDGNLDLVTLRGGDIEAWDISQTSPQLLWQFDIGGDSVETISYVASRHAIAVVPSITGSRDKGLYQFDINSKTLTKVHSRPVFSAQDSIIADINGDNALELISKFAVYDYQSGELLMQTNLGNFPATAVGDFNGDGQQDIAWGLTIFSGTDLSLIDDISNDEPGVQAFSVAFYDYDNDGKDEFIATFKQTDYEAETSHWKLYVYQFENGKAVEKLTLLTSDEEISFQVSASGVIFAKGFNNQLHRFIIAEDLSAQESSEMTITESPLSSACKLDAVENNKLFLICLYVNEAESSRDYFVSQITWGEAIASLPVTFNLTGDGLYGNLYMQNEQLSVSALTGVYVFDNIQGSSFLPRSNYWSAGAELGYYPEIHDHTILNGTPLFWNKHFDSKIQVIDMQSQLVGEVYGNFLSYQMEPLNINGGYILVDNKGKLHFINQTSLEIEYSYEDAPSQSTNSSYAVKHFTWKNAEYVAVWKEQYLLLFNYSDGFQFITKFALPESFQGHHYSFVMEHAIDHGKNVMVFIQDYENKVILDLDTLEFEAATLTLDRPRLLSVWADKSCITKVNDKHTKNAYIFSFNLGADEIDTSDQRRAPKLVEYDLIYDELIWTSKKLSGNFYSVNDVICGENVERQSLAFSSTYKVIITQ